MASNFHVASISIGILIKKLFPQPFLMWSNFCRRFMIKRSILNISRSL